MVQKLDFPFSDIILAQLTTDLVMQSSFVSDIILLLHCTSINPPALRAFFVEGDGKAR